MATISVTGTARRSLRPDRGTARVFVQFEGPQREEVVTAARALHERLTADARRFVQDEAATEWSADQVWVSTTDRYRGEKKEPRRVTVATASVSVTFVDLVALGRWLAEIAEQEGAAVHGVGWGLADERRRRIEGEVRTEAVLDALERARAYASAVGLETVELVAVQEPGLRRGEDAGGGPMYRMVADTMESAVAPEFAVRPQDIDVAAEVTADFAAR